MNNMKPSDLFGVAVRSVGLVIGLYGVWYCIYVLFIKVGAIQEDPLEDLEMYLAYGVTHLIAAAFMMRGGAMLVAFAYPSEQADSNPAE